MQLVEQHVIKRSDPRYAVIDEAAFKSKNLYNAALYEIRQSFIFQKKYLNHYKMDKLMQQHEAYKALPAKVAQQVLKGLHQNWASFFEACKAYKADPSKFTGHPKLPKYKHKTEGRNILVYSLQALAGGRSKKGLTSNIKPSGLPIAIETKQDPTTINQVRIVPRNGYYVVEVVYTKVPEPAIVDPSYYAGIDIGTNNLAALTSNKPGFIPRIINGRPVKSVNQYYNKRYKQLRKKLPKAERTTTVTRRMEWMTTQRTRRIDHYLHTASKRIVDILVEEGIGTLVIGRNDGWKQEVNMGRRNNQTFVQIPHARFIDMLTYKAELVGILVLITEESYTSAASFLDRDPLPTYNETNHQKYQFSGTRIKRGLYRASGGRYINADCNGSYNIVRKVAPNAFQAQSVEDFAVHPVRITLAK